MTHIDKAIVQATEKRVLDARLRLKVTIDSIRYAPFSIPNSRILFIVLSMLVTILLLLILTGG